MKKIIYALLIGLFALIVAPTSVTADGGLVYDPIYTVSENEQQAVIFHENGIETLAISMKFSGDADEFGWLIPTPNKPEVDKASKDLFANIDEITEYNSGNYRNNKVGYALGAISDTAGKNVTIVDQKTIDYYEITTLQATDSEALSKWLNDNGYKFPEEHNSILKDYINNDWYIVAIKIDATADGSTITGDLKSGQATPILLTFESKNIVFPMKLSQISVPESGKSTKNLSNDALHGDIHLTSLGSRSYSDKNDPERLSVDLPSLDINSDNHVLLFDGVNDYVYTDLNIDQSLSTDNSYTFEAWVYPINTSEGTSYILGTDDGGFDWSLVQRGDEWIIFTGETIYNTKIKVDLNKWQHIAGVFSNGKAVLFYKDGVFSGSSTNMGYDSLSNNLQIGGNIKYDNYYSGYIDEVRVWSEARTSDQILQNYDKELTGLESNLLRYWQFEEMEAGGQVVRTTTDPPSTDTPSGHPVSFVDSSYDFVHVELYVITDNKTFLSGFETNYANTFNKRKIKNLANDEEGNSWIEPKHGDYWITRMSDNLEVDDMKNDLYITNAHDSKKVGVGPGLGTKILAILLVVLYTIAGIIIIFSGLIYLIPTLILIKKRRRKIRILCYVFQYFALFVFVVFLLISMLLAYQIYDGDYPFTYISANTGVLDLSVAYSENVVMVVPVLIMLIVIVVQIIYVVKMTKRQGWFKREENNLI